MDLDKGNVKTGPDEKLVAEVQEEAAPPPRAELPGSKRRRCLECPRVSAGSGQVTNHMDCHNSPHSTDGSVEDEYTCGVCQKTLSSASSLARHVVVHSGERPFKCKLCDMAFTTSGNMNRHHRTAHGDFSPASYSDSDGSSDSEKPPLPKRQHVDEYNNNDIDKRKSPNPSEVERDSPDSVTKRKYPTYRRESTSPRKREVSLGNSGVDVNTLSELQRNINDCPVCGKQDFTTGALLESHIERCHPDFPATCEICSLTFKNHRVLNLHRFMVHNKRYANGQHVRNSRNSIVGFHDLTFVDFSSGKFPTIARAVCEQSMHKPAMGEVQFQCSKCLRGFPCRTALDAHETDCGTASPPSRSAQDEENPDNNGQSRRDDFFAGLDLQNIAALAEAKEGKDLADIQSIISNTAKLPLPVLPRSDTSTPENNVKFTPNSSSSGSSGTFSSENHEEEAQDAFAAEFRKMKLKGEFPCRLCTAIFPNLRALKGHNRAHMGVAPGMPYPCNMCTYTSTDKATLVRHLRSHNGDRPYECSLCNYAFTTKANCERHVRNRHGKLTREDIKSVLIYHPNEDSTNDSTERNSLRVIRDDTRKVLLYPNERDESIQQSPLHFPSMPMEAAGEIRIIEEAKLRESALSSLCTIQTSRYDNPSQFSQQRPLELIRKTSDDLNELREPNTANSDYSKADEDLESRSSDGSVSLVNDAKANACQITQASPINLKKTSENASTDNNEEDGPLDLSMDVLDLSKKSEKANNTTNPDEPQYERNPQELYDARNQLLLTQALLESGQGSSQSQTLESLYANAHLVYRNFGTFSGILPPYLFDPRNFNQDFAMKERLRKELVRGLQLTSGGTLVEPTITNPGFAAFTQGRETLASQSSLSNERTDYAKLMSAKIAAKVVAPRDKPADSTSASNSVKMVIKNGVLMPKQKQRRYRTERPFTCEHCAARFTLRSNMERHIKQQHPQHWSQRPRGGHSTRGRPPASHPTLLQNLGQTNAQLPPSFPNILPRSEQPEGSSAQYSKHPISEQVKYAILAQQLKANKVDENESEEELVIDEDPKDRDNHDNQEQTERSTSLLREHLEGTELLKGEIKIEVEDPAPSNLTGAVEDISHEENAQIKKEGESQLQVLEETGDLEKETIAGRVENEDTEIIPKIEHVKEEEKQEDGQDLASVSELLEHASQQYQQFQPQYLSDDEGHAPSTSDGNNSGSDEKSDSVHSANSSNTASSDMSIRKRKMLKKKSAYSMAPNRVICPFCQRPFPWTSSLRRHILTHTGQKPFQCVYCSLFFTTKSNCDRHLLRKHKNNPTRMRRALRVSSSPEPRASTSNDNSFSMRNVPERPYKCNLCPSSTFSTLGNLKKHRSTKHSWKSDSRPESPSSENRNSPPEQENPKLNEQSDNESHSSSNSENNGNSSTAAIPQPNPNDASLPSTSDGSRSRRPSPRSSPAPSDVPFKCHLCDNGFAERQDCLEHIRINHKKSYEMLVAKGALDMDIDVPDEQQQQQQQTPQQTQHQPSDGEERRGRFPDYSNRKVVCAFCMRRFWSAEDLRRHMRTHTGERPFSCDICCRRFTLKHSMLRHRKKHESVDSTMYVGTSGDEEISPAQPPTITPRTQQQSSALVTTNLNNPRLQERISLPTVASVATADAAPSGLMNFSPYDELTTLTGRLTNTQPSTQPNTQPTASSVTDAGDGAENDLISNLLGIPDKSLIDRVLQASADDAAKLLGVKRNE